MVRIKRLITIWNTVSVPLRIVLLVIRSRYFVPNPRNQLYFLHIKKTAGTSLRMMLEQNFRVDEIHNPVNTPVFNTFSEDYVKHLKLVVGHFDVSYHRYFGTKLTMITMLREPIDRSLSEYYYWHDNQNIDDDPRKPERSKLHALSNYVANPQNKDAVRDIQTRSLALGILTPDRFILSTSTELEMAKKRLRDIFFFGLCEQMQLSIDMLNYIMGWRPSLFNIRENVTRKRESVKSISSDEYQLVCKANENDIMLYKYAKALFRLRYVAFLVSTLGIWKALKLKNDSYSNVRELVEPALWRKYYQKTSSIRRSSILTYTFDMPLLGDGWWAREGQATMTEYIWRWTRDKVAELDLPLRRDTRLLFIFRLKTAIPIDLSIMVDRKTDVEVHPLSSRLGGAADFMYWGILPSWPLWKQQMSTISFVVTALVTPKSISGDNVDTRSLGVAVDWVHVEPWKNQF